MSYIYDFAIYMRFCRGLGLKKSESTDDDWDADQDIDGGEAEL